MLYFKFRCGECGWKGERYRNVKKCPKCGKRKLAMAKMPKLNIDGVPVDASDWTKDDWKDLHRSIERIKKRVAWRHSV